MKYQYSKIVRDEKEFTLIKTYGAFDGDLLQPLISKHDPDNMNVIAITIDNNGLNQYHGIGEHRVNSFSTHEKFDNLDWKEGYLGI